MVARFLVDIDGLESEYPDDAKAQGWLPRVVHGKQTARVLREALRTIRNPEGSLVKAAFDSMYAVVEAEVAALGWRLLSPDTLRASVPYLIGYPAGSARSVVQEGRFLRAIEVEIDVTVPDQGTGYFAVIGTGKATTKGRPEMIMRMRYVAADGTEWREKVRVRSTEKVVLSERWILGVRTDTGVPDASTLPELTRRATVALIREWTADAQDPSQATRPESASGPSARVSSPVECPSDPCVAGDTGSD